MEKSRSIRLLHLPAALASRQSAVSHFAICKSQCNLGRGPLVLSWPLATPSSPSPTTSNGHLDGPPVALARNGFSYARLSSCLRRPGRSMSLPNATPLIGECEKQETYPFLSPTFARLPNSSRGGSFEAPGGARLSCADRSHSSRSSRLGRSSITSLVSAHTGAASACPAHSQTSPGPSRERERARAPGPDSCPQRPSRLMTAPPKHGPFPAQSSERLFCRLIRIAHALTYIHT